MKTLLFIALALAGISHAAEPRIIYSKSFRGSKPDFVSITLERSGHAVYKEALNDENPLELQVPQEDVTVVFNLADKLNHFTRDLDSHMKVAYTGAKSFTWDDGAQKHTTTFNYSINPDARLLADWFERVSETEQRFIDLDRTIHFDKLGVNDALLQVNLLYDRKRLIAPLQFVPLLNRISANEGFMHIARERAASLADQFQKPTRENIAR